MQTFYGKLKLAWTQKLSLLCVGLDSDRGFLFNKKIIEDTHDLVCAYKPNSAFYESRGAKGIAELKRTCDYIRKKYPAIVLILDFKRADIGNSNMGYVSFAYEYLGVDAVTLHPYLGREALQPFLDRKEKGSFILCRTSNPGAGEFQDEMYQKVARNVATYWNTNKNCALVVGATYPGELAIVRRIVNHMPILIPGIGAQGGNIKRAVRAGIDGDGFGIIIAVGRDVIFAKRPREEAVKLRNQINMYRNGGK
jgi:orotidine-5'-phosphate decarboxylase